MRHHQYNPDFDFVKKPENFNKYTDKDFLQYCLGAILYTPGTKDFKDIILNNKFPGLTTVVLDFEDGIDGRDLAKAEDNVIESLGLIAQKINSQEVSKNKLPLILIRVRNIEQFKEFTARLDRKIINLLTGFELPKFNSDNGFRYLEHLKKLKEKFDEILYALPVLEDEKVAYKENRMDELINLKKIISSYKKLVLNMGIGGTDFSSLFNLRRDIDKTIYDLMNVKDCLNDIMNFFNRKKESYIFSGAVWEYFNNDYEIAYKKLKEKDFPDLLFRKERFINKAVDGLLKEIILDKANGFIGKGIIHPSQIKYVNAMQAVTKEKYEDALQILDTTGGVIKSGQQNKMNEINPHQSWAKKIKYRAKAYGVIKDNSDYVKLFAHI